MAHNGAGTQAPLLVEPIPLVNLGTSSLPVEPLQRYASSDADAPVVERITSGDSDFDPKKPDPDGDHAEVSAEVRAREAKYLTGGTQLESSPRAFLLTLMRKAVVSATGKLALVFTGMLLSVFLIALDQTILVRALCYVRSMSLAR